MSDYDTTAEQPDPPKDPDAIRAEIEQTRADLAETVDALAAKLDVKGQASDKADAAKARIGEKAAQVKASAPEPVQHAVDALTAKATPVAHQLNAQTAPNRGKILAGVGVGVLVLLVLRRRRKATADS